MTTPHSPCLHGFGGRSYGRIWNADRAHEGWRPYQGASVYNTTLTTPDGITGGHYDHVHISVY